MRAYERLLNYVKIHTTSDESSASVPTTARQFDLARVLVDEMKALGITDARVEDNCYVYGTIPATPGYEDKTSIGFIAHLDTAPDFCGENVNPQIHENYDGEEIEGTDFTDALKALKASDLTSEEPSEKDEMSFTLHYKDDKSPEKEVKIYRYDGTNCLVTIDGKSISLVKRDLVVDLTEAVNAIVLK